MFTFQRHRLMIALAILFLAAGSAEAKRYKTEQRSLDINLHGLFSPSRHNMDSKAGAALTGYYDFRLMPLMSMGVNIGAVNYFADPGFQVYYVELAGRLFPVKATKSGELYLQGGMGWFFPKDNPIDDYKWQIHGTAGIGYKKFLSGNKYLNLGFNYDVYSPKERPTNNFGVKIGYGMRMGRLHTPGRGRKAAAVPKASVAATVVATPIPTQKIVVVTPKVTAPKPVAPKPTVKVVVPKAAAPKVVAPAKPVVNVEATRTAAAKIAADKAAAAKAAAAKAAAVKAAATKAAAAKVAAPVVAKPTVKPAVVVPTVKAAAPVIALDLGGGKTAKPVVNIDLGGGKTVKSAVGGAMAPVTYTWTANDSLPALAEAFYGDADLYPIIVDANSAKLVMRDNLKAGVKILIPRSVDDTTKAKARAKSSVAYYKQWAATGKK